MDLRDIPDNIFKLAMLRLICANLDINDEDINKMAIIMYKTSRGQSE